jgi:hypothetical protein
MRDGTRAGEVTRAALIPLYRLSLLLDRPNGANWP